jgi:nucleoside 2-deoxyribosyltransferase
MLKTRPPLRIFIYHAQGDSETVNALADLLFLHGVEVTLPEEAEAEIKTEEEEQLPAEKEAALQKLIREADAILLCLSDRFTQEASSNEGEWESV